MTRLRSCSGAVVADMRGGDSQRLFGEHPKKGAHGGNMVSPMLLGLRGDTLKEVLLGDAEPAPS